AKRHKDVQEAILDEDTQPVTSSGWKTAAFIIAGLVTLPIAAELTVNSAISIAEVWDVPDDVIGLTIVAIGTSLPELATAVMAARAATTSVLVGSIIGSNFFNIAAIMGITALVVPVPVTQHILDFDVWVMAAATLFLVLLATLHMTIGRLLGAILFGFYVVYLVATVAL
ncbi:MAG: sodium:calcium antiporter, partial [Pseudomonadota bacterium]